MWDIRTIDCAESSQDCVREALLTGAGEGHCVRVLEQTQGRGRHGRAWASLQGSLFFSFLLKPTVPMSTWGSLSLLAGVALAQAVDESRAVLKWPNDLMIDGAKAAGILVEIEGDAAIVGIGINLHNVKSLGRFHIESDLHVASLGAKYDAEDLMNVFLDRFVELYGRWLRGGFSAVKAEWLLFSYEVGAAMSVKLPREIVAGYFAGIDDTGALLLDNGNGFIRTLTMGDVTHVTGD
jgi:BirA family biotin operon repressor/biotin-[acetyl-CoA-carboxylase] ligase